LRLSQAESDIDVQSERPISIIRLDRVRQTVEREVSNAGLHVAEELNVPCISQRVRIDAECASGSSINPLLKIGLIAEQFVSIN
jgi:hypothetical protein